MHALLQRQLGKVGLSPDVVPSADGWRALLGRVERAYQDADQDRYTLEHSLAVCSREIQELQDRVSRERDRLGATVSCMGDALCVVGLDGRIELANPAADELLQARGTLVGHDFVDIVSGGWPREKERRAPLRDLARCIANGRSYRADDARFFTRGHVVFPVSFVLTPVLRDGVAQSTVIIFREIRERKAAEDALRESESRFRAIFASAAVGIVRLKLDGEIAESNRAFADMLGMSPAELVGRSKLDFVHPSELRASREHFAACREGRGTPHAVERRYVRKDGSLVWGAGSLSLLKSDAGEPLFVINVVENITQTKALEVELRHAQKLESVGRLAAGVAHEINTPIQFIGDNIHFLQTAFRDLFALREGKTALLAEPVAAIAGLAEALAELDRRADVEYLAAEIPKAITQSLEGVTQVARIVHAMKQFSHPDIGNEQSSVDLNASIQSTLTVARNEIKHVADVETELGELPMILGYAGDLNQVLLNLLVNAAHAIGDVMEKTGERGRITVRTSVDGDHVVASIGDTGGGIPEAIRERVYDPFFTTKEVGKGTGQGLALARAIVVDKHHGELTFVSEIGVGTTFSVRLPVAGAAQEAAE